MSALSRVSSGLQALTFLLQQGVGEFLIPWVLSDGFIKPMMINAGLTSIFLLIGGVLMIMFGKKLRGLSKNSFVHRM